MSCTTQFITIDETYNVEIRLGTQVSTICNNNNDNAHNVNTKDFTTAKSHNHKQLTA